VTHATSDVAVRGLRLRLHRWSPTGAPRGDLVLLLHGFLDAGSTFDMVAEPLAAAGLEVVAPDLRGFGASDRVGDGGYYHFPDYVADVDALVRALCPPPGPPRVALVGHSMGGGVATLFAGTNPDAVSRLAVLEGWGPMDTPAELAVDQMRRHLRDLGRIDRAGRPLASMEDAVDRLAASHPRIGRDVLASRAERLVRRDPSGALQWAWDPLHRTTAPTPFLAPVYASFLRAIACPTLSISGGPHGWHPPDEEERLALVRDLRRAEIPGAGHMMHWTAPAEVARILAGFLLEGAAPTRA
jgi:pimeloyl-ACP methyl ester carboxylesterase